MKFDLYILREKGKNRKLPLLWSQISIALDKNTAYAFDSKGIDQIVDPLHVVEIEIVKDGMLIRGLEQSSDKQTAWYQEWWLRPPSNDKTEKTNVKAAIKQKKGS